MGKALALSEVGVDGYRRLVRMFAIFGAILLACVSHRVDAAIPEAATPARIFAELGFNFFPPDPIDVVTFGEHQLSGPGGRLRIDSALFPSPYLHASVVDIRDGYFGRVSASLSYDFLVIGPDTADPIEVIVTSIGEVKGNALPPPLGTGAFALKATWTITNTVGGTPLFVEGGIVTPQLSGNFFDSFEDVVQLDLVANQRYRVTLVADAGIANGFTNGAAGSARAFVDPIFTFGPSVGSEYSFVFSEGVGNTLVPEPSTYVFMAVGLALGVFRKRLLRV